MENYIVGAQSLIRTKRAFSKVLLIKDPRKINKLFAHGLQKQYTSDQSPPQNQSVVTGVNDLIHSTVFGTWIKIRFVKIDQKFISVDQTAFG